MKVKQLVGILLRVDQEKDVVVSECGVSYQHIVGVLESTDGNFDGMIVVGEALMENFGNDGNQSSEAPV